METATLDNGLRIITDYRPGQVVYCGLAVAAGTRHELPEESGMAHFTEHMSFKGTEHRRAWHIINRMEAVGGELNAYTGKEDTIYYCTTQRQHLRRALDLLFDIVFHSTYPQREMEREVEVVIDEIESYNDSPSELIYDDFDAFLFQNHPLGRNILGSADCLRGYCSEDMHRFVGRLYHPSRMVLFVLGDVSLKNLGFIKRLEAIDHIVSPEFIDNLDHIDHIESLANPTSPLIIKKNTHQAHVIVGTKGCSMSDPDRLSLYLLNNILGGPGMNSRLNLSLRERRGLVYTVESSLTSYTDTGVWTTYFGCDHDDVERCRRLVEREISRLTEAPLSASALAAAKRQLKGQIALSWENGENVAIAMGRRLLHCSNTQTQQQLCDEIDRLSAQHLWDVARAKFDPACLLTLIYP